MYFELLNDQNEILSVIACSLSSSWLSPELLRFHRDEELDLGAEVARVGDQMDEGGGGGGGGSNIPKHLGLIVTFPLGSYFSALIYSFVLRRCE